MGSWVKAAVGIGLSGILFLSGDTQMQSQAQTAISTITAYLDNFEKAEEEEPFTTDVHYCRDNLELFEKYYPELAEELLEDGSICVEAPAPPGAVINDVQYYNQCAFENRKGGYEGLYQPCLAGCGPATVKMALEYAGLGEQDIYTLFDDLWTGSISGTSDDSMQRVLTAKEVYGGQFINMNWEALTQHIRRGNLVQFHIASDRNVRADYGHERPCGAYCPPGGHHALIVGISEDELIMHDPFTSPEGENHEYGEYLVLSRDTLEDMLSARWNIFTVVFPVGSAPDEVVETPDNAYFDYYPTAWPYQRGTRFGDFAWWQRGFSHTGLDIFGRLGEDIYAVKEGTVAGIGCLKCRDHTVATSGYGLSVSIHHGDIEGVPIYTLYPHLDEAYVNYGDKVEGGQLIGAMGNTGFCKPRHAYHTHFGVSIENPFYEPWDDYAESGEYMWLDPELFLGEIEELPTPQ